ncbi:hypothetical protein T458_05005 [Brevibacillus panacihumi W25]|uniref:Uncharacterized protein n=1 Tax=Brevibacillus panacihumi W25 TaxID=1408254 RepID=V6MDP2_9BACL|nr:hypothetical protein [Brevibacillus panacihumi]EST56651.1 hypothetical protein T458_05005 [Brevibacillus panacihumi W25]
MDVEVYYDGQRREAIPYSALPALRLFCQEQGFQLQWDPEAKRVDLGSGLKGKVFMLIAGGMDDDTGLEYEVLSRTASFLRDVGAKPVLLERGDESSGDSDAALRFSAKELPSLDESRLILFQGDDERRRRLLHHVFHEMKESGIPCQIRISKRAKTSVLLPIQWHVPSGLEGAKRSKLAEQIAISLVSGILRDVHEGQGISPISYLLPHLLQTFFGQVQKLEEWETKDQKEQQEQQVHQPALVEAVAEVHQEEKEEKQIIERPILPTEVKMPTPIATEQRIEAEVYFDYTLMHHETENRPYLLIGSLIVKNTGTEALYNPVVCLRVNPIEGIKLGGQILPPNMVETLGVQGQGGAKGWKYMEDDWFEQAKERGEYWIAPIQPMIIPPKMSEAFQNFQISFFQQEERTTITVEGIVMVNDQQLHFPANNRIAVSF